MTSYDTEDLYRAAAAAIRAPSLHNSQPWRFQLVDGGIEVLADAERQMAVADRGSWAVHVACGAATFNTRLALAAAGVPARVVLRPDPGSEVMARLTPGPIRAPSSRELDLFRAIARRTSNRRPFWSNPVPPEVRGNLLEAARVEGAWLDLLVGMTALSGFAEIAQGAERVLQRNYAYQAEMTTWIHTTAAPDGIAVSAGAPVAHPQDLLPQRPYGLRERGPGRDYEPEPLVAVLGTTGDWPIDHLVAGQALQRILLTATAAGLATSMISQPVEVAAAREQLQRSLRRQGTPQMTVRIGYGEPGTSSSRRDLADVIVT